MYVPLQYKYVRMSFQGRVAKYLDNPFLDVFLQKI